MVYQLRSPFATPYMENIARTGIEFIAVLPNAVSSECGVLIELISCSSTLCSYRLLPSSPLVFLLP
jgi:hypothetical protein